MFKKSLLALPLAFGVAVSLAACSTGSEDSAGSGGTENDSCISTVKAAVDEARAPLDLDD